MHRARQRWVGLGTVCIFLNAAAKILALYQPRFSVTASPLSTNDHICGAKLDLLEITIMDISANCNVIMTSYIRRSRLKRHYLG